MVAAVVMTMVVAGRGRNFRRTVGGMSAEHQESWQDVGGMAVGLVVCGRKTDMVIW